MFEFFDSTIPGQPINEEDEKRLKRLFHRCIVQSEFHEENIEKIIRLILEEMRREFSEDNDKSLYLYFFERLNNAAALALPFVGEDTKHPPSETFVVLDASKGKVWQSGEGQLDD